LPDEGSPDGTPAGTGGQPGYEAQVRSALADAAQQHPLVLVLDDLQWADAASLELLRVVGRTLAAVPVFLLVTYRSDELTRRHPLAHLLPVLVREARALRLDLRPLREDGVRALVEDRYQLPSGDVARLAAYLQQRAEGNPFFSGEVLRALEEDGILRPTEQGWTLGELGQVRMPVLLRQVIEGRLLRLGEEARGLLEMAAVIGHDVPLALWAEATGSGEDVLVPMIERAVDARLVEATPDGRGMRFAHALIREALYEGLLPPRRRSWHRRVGETLAAGKMPPDPDAVAYHFQQAGDARASRWLVMAGERAQRTGAWLTAAARYETALSLLDEDEAHVRERGWLLFRLAVLRRFTEVRRGVGYLEEAERCARVASDGALHAYALFNRGLLHCMSGAFRRGLAELQAGVAALDALPRVERARLQELESIGDPLDAHNGRGELTLWLAETGRYGEARALAEQLVGSDGGPAVDEATAGSRGDAYYGLGYAYAGLGQPDEARRAFARARELFRTIDHRTMIMSTLGNELFAVVLPYQADRQVERQRLVAEITGACARLEDLMSLPTPRAAYLPLLILGGEWSEARHLLLSYVGEEDPNHLYAASMLGPLAHARGEEDLAWTQVRSVFAEGPLTAPGDVACYTVGLQRLAALLALEAGDLATAREWLEAHDRWLRWSGSVLGAADALLTWAAYYRTAGDPHQARTTATNALTHAADPRQPLALLAAHRLLGELDTAAGRLDEAETHLEAALSLAEACAAPYERALTLLALAEVRQARGDLPTARSMVDAGRALCRPLEAAPALARAEALAVRLTTASGLARAPSPAGLSPREVEVLRLLAAGLSNAHIAARLVVSPRTINAHLTAIYGKLRVSSRGAAIRRALDLGLR
jgi:DNA-binding CsgD family transcriptional regulator/tetratricopeptide (TPR) repeat protein